MGRLPVVICPDDDDDDDGAGNVWNVFFPRFLHNEGFPPLGTRGCYQLEVIFWRNFSLPAGDDAVLAFKQFILMIMMIFMNFNEHNMRSCTRNAMFMGFATATVCTAALMLVCWFLEVLERSYRR